jgi:hypothetical protein
MKGVFKEVFVLGLMVIYVSAMVMHIKESNIPPDLNPCTNRKYFDLLGWRIYDSDRFGIKCKFHEASIIEENILDEVDEDMDDAVNEIEKEILSIENEVDEIAKVEGDEIISMENGVNDMEKDIISLVDDIINLEDTTMPSPLPPPPPLGNGTELNATCNNNTNDSGNTEK